jgi:hypothetical protein
MRFLKGWQTRRILKHLLWPLSLLQARRDWSGADLADRLTRQPERPQ